MTLIQKIRLQGFKSFPKLTEIVFPPGFSCILGPNGSGKTNITDSICFVLGKSSSSELRAEKAANLIYNGGKRGSPYKDASVDIFFDNSNNEFPIKDNPIKISRIVKQNGQSTYKLIDKTVTRQQIIDLLAHSKIDPEGHNIILQGDIIRFMEMKPVERREIIEEIAGISIYEDKKAKSLNELEKVDVKLKEAEIILTEREVNLRELKKERDQALRYKEMEEKIRDSKATFIHLQIKEKETKKDEIEAKINENRKKLNIIEENINNFKNEINNFKNEIREITSEIEEKGEKEQFELRKKIEILKTDIVRLRERSNTCRNEIEKIGLRKKQLKTETSDINEKIKTLKEEKIELENKIKSILSEEGKLSENINKLKEKNEELAKLRAKNLSLKEITGDFAIKKILSLKDPQVYGTISQLGKVDSKYALALEVVAGSRIKSIVVEDDKVAEKCIKILKENRLGVATFLPLNKIKPRYIESVNGGELAINLIKFDSKFKDAFSYIFGSTLIVKNIEEARKIGIGKVRMVTLDGDLIEQAGAMIGGYRKALIGFKEDDMFKLEREIKELSEEIYKFENKKLNNERIVIELRGEIRNIGIQISNMLMPEGTKVEKIFGQHEKEEEEFKKELDSLTKKIREYEKGLKDSEELEKKFYSKAKDFINKRSKLEDNIKNKEEKITREEEKYKTCEDIINNLSINKAKVIAEFEALNKEFDPFKDGKIRRNVSFEELKVQIQECERTLKSLGSVNLRALDVYDSIEKDYQELLRKSDKLKIEKEDVLKMIAEIESKKKDIFMRTFDIINKNFKIIFSSLSTKGEAHLDLEDVENPFNAGMDVKVKITGNKFLDIRSLSGGEKTLTALALIFAIQEYEPASFYLLDEVDAALDKTNSELLSKLLKKYSKNAQYIVISHNDATITEADQIYGVSMQDGVSKIISLKV